MTGLPFDDASGANDTLVCGLTPGGRIHVQAACSEDGPRVPLAAARRILDAFEAGRGHGVLYLGAALPGAELHPSLAYWRDFGRSFVTGVCGALDPTDPASVVVPDPDPVEVAAAVQAAPPMPGAESITPELLNGLWLDVGEALAARAAESKDGVQGYLKAQSPIWNVVGRVCLHLAENRRDPDYPFAFIATYVREVSRRAAPSHLPLGRALEQYAGTRNRGKLLALLAPLSRAAEDSEFIRELVDSGDVYHPLPWTPAEAHRFLQEVALYERAGLVVRTPDWWSARSRPRPRVSVTVGDQTPSMLGMKGLLDFDVALTVDGKTLSRKEIRALLASTEGLALIRGKWVEVDSDQLSAVLAQWREVQDRARLDGVGFGEAMRLLAGVTLEDRDKDEDHPPEWSEVLAGKWLSEKLDALRSPGPRADIDAGAGLRAELRPYQKRGVQWLWTLRGLGLGGCLADDMGLGKTLQVLAVLSLTLKTGEKETDLLVLPASLIDNWSQEIQRHAPFLKVLVAHPSYIPSAELKELSPVRVKAHHAVITTYGTVLRTEWMKKYPWRTVVLDEAQAIKNPAAKQTRAVKALPSKWRLVLTGTPVENRLGDLWSIFDFLNPGLLGSAKAFNRLAKSMASGEGEGYAPLRRLVAPYILRRLKTDKTVIADLPDKTEVNAWCLLSRRQAALYQQSVDEMKKAHRDAGRHPAARHGPGFSDAFQADLQPPVPLVGRRAFRPRRQRQVRAHRRVVRIHRRAPGQGAGVHPVPRDDRTALGLSRGGLRMRRSGAARRHAGPAAPGTREAFPGGRPDTVHGALAQGRRYRTQPDRGLPRDPFRPLVESSGGESGHRPRVSHRPEEERAGPQVRVPRHRGGTHP